MFSFDDVIMAFIPERTTGTKAPKPTCLGAREVIMKAMGRTDKIQQSAHRESLTSKSERSVNMYFEINTFANVIFSVV